MRFRYRQKNSPNGYVGAQWVAQMTAGGVGGDEDAAIWSYFIAGPLGGTLGESGKFSVFVCATRPSRQCERFSRLSMRQDVASLPPRHGDGGIRYWTRMINNPIRGRMNGIGSLQTLRARFSARPLYESGVKVSKRAFSTSGMSRARMKVCSRSRVTAWPRVRALSFS